MARAFAIALIEISGLPECDKVEIRFVLRFLRNAFMRRFID